MYDATSLIVFEQQLWRSLEELWENKTQNETEDIYSYLSEWERHIKCTVKAMALLLILLLLLLL